MDVSMNNNLESLRLFFIENISKFCDKCGAAYKPELIDIVSETNASVIIQAQCDNCKSIYMAHVIKPLQMTKKVPIRLDIAPGLLRPYYAMGPVTSDELLVFRKKILKARTRSGVMEALGSHAHKTAKRIAKYHTQSVKS